MKSYSKVFKADHLALKEDVKVITQPLIPIKINGEFISPSSLQHTTTEAVHKANQIIDEADAKAQTIIDMAKQKARQIEVEAEEKMKQWWEEKEKKMEALTMESQKKGFQDGYEQGKRQAEDDIRQEYQSFIEQAQQLLEQAYEQKAKIISEAEPFLLELSTAIASQIIKQELTDHPEAFLELVKQHILRFKEKESITVCVHPDDFEWIQGQRAHLNAVVNGETEIKILPDHSVSAKGCVIRTAYGSIDARIDTQMEEIKKVLLEARREQESEIISG
ncbi:flagellar assembly protein FliH [Bacillus thermocopriae]|uniref:Flagellar assembly protein FliH n=1 Tax=Neobacillus thermocopriae TaxID=1215031 RepID=A0A6B3TM81_9BACI|nr:flagellar assembly protein FliH [Neobacillus thermocopriae]NEX78044.1 flagellar assembly protein FliH [Neobacillus thermocopriae]